MTDGLYYVMLSRAESKDNVFLKNFLPNKLKPNKEALEEDKRLQERFVASSFEKMEFNSFLSISGHYQSIWMV